MGTDAYLGGYCEGPEVDRGGAFESERHSALCGHVFLVIAFFFFGMI